MFVRNRVLSISFKVIVFLSSGFGLYLNSGIPRGQFDISMLKYYTILSNLFVFFAFGWFVFSAIKTIRTDGFYGPTTKTPAFKGAVTMAITVTMLIYQVVLSNTPFAMGASDVPLSNSMVHLFVPFLAIADWALFDEKGKFCGSDPLYWLVPPLAYYAFVLIAAPFGMRYFGGSRFPYHFIDSDALGWGSVFINVSILLLFFLALGYLIVLLDNVLGRIGKKETHKIISIKDKLAEKPFAEEPIELYEEQQNEALPASPK